MFYLKKERNETIEVKMQGLLFVFEKKIVNGEINI